MGDFGPDFMKFAGESSQNDAGTARASAGCARLTGDFGATGLRRWRGLTPGARRSAVDFPEKAENAGHLTCDGAKSG
ncbi:MAG: hypothetical protein EP318_06385 [Rhodobacteraceae bacterium]|nr:MAG: hypothetical protein EP318_06385 [Paracoccaceae bacterium]